MQRRPYVQEAVAPYVKPQTPETRSLYEDEAREALERDWMHQADRNPTPERIRQEIGWARELAARHRTPVAPSAPLPSPRTAHRPAGLHARVVRACRAGAACLVACRPRPRPLSQGPRRQAPHRVPQPRCSISTRCSSWTCPSRKAPSGSTRRATGWATWRCRAAACSCWTASRPTASCASSCPRPPCTARSGGRTSPSTPSRVLVCFKPHNEKSFHLYEINVDGTGLRQLTDGPFDDLDPIYLPDEQHMVFSTTRGNTYVRCMPPTSAFVLARCDRDGGNLYLISANNEPDYLPCVMNDGRILYTRWEYTDKPLWRAEKLWTVYPDGTQTSMLWGNQSVWPDLLKDARSIPGSRRVMFTGSAHHDWFSGSVGIITPDAGLNFPDGLAKITADVPWPECGNGPVDPVESPRYHRSGEYRPYYSPYPLSEQDFLVSANRGGKFVLYLMDVDGNRELIYEGTHNIFHALPLRPRAQAARAARRCRLARTGGTLHAQGRRLLQRRHLPGRARRAARQGQVPARAQH